MSIRDDQYLFVGGPKDGCRICIPEDQSYIHFPLVGSVPVNTVIYRRHVLGSFLAVYAIDRMNTRDVIMALIDRYPLQLDEAFR